MGLHVFASSFRKRIFLDPEMDLKFDKKFGSSFGGKSYDTVFNAITDETLYFPCCPKQIYERLTDFIEKNKEKMESDTINNDEIDIRDYLDDYEDAPIWRYKIDILSLYGLRDFFKICYLNNLYVLPSR